MGKKYTMCKGTHGVVWENNTTEYCGTWIGQEHGVRPENIKRKRLPCPNCGRRLLSSVELCHDACCIIHSIPDHKPKNWWKKGKPRKVRR